MGFLSDLMGKSAAKRAEAAGAAAKNTLTQGYQTARGDYERGQGRLDPFAAQSAKGYGAYTDSLGLNGRDAQARTQGMYFDDPIQQRLMSDTTRTMGRQFGARGLGNSGASNQAVANALLRGWTGYQDRLGQLGTQGVQIAGMQGQYDQGMGDLAYGNAQQQANVGMQTANAVNQARAQGMNNLISGLSGLGGLALGGFTPGASGASAFGNMLGGMGSSQNALTAGSPYGYNDFRMGFASPSQRY